jgi:hypothetical protein
MKKEFCSSTFIQGFPVLEHLLFAVEEATTLPVVVEDEAPFFVEVPFPVCPAEPLVTVSVGVASVAAVVATAVTAAASELNCAREIVTS